jgi:hypothetical protein
MNEMIELGTKDVPPPSQPDAPEPPPDKKPVQSVSNKPQEGSVPLRK